MDAVLWSSTRAGFNASEMRVESTQLCKLDVNTSNLWAYNIYC